MFKIIALFCLLVLALAAEQDVLEFGDDDFVSGVAEHDTILVMFYAPWCGHCKRLKPEYAKAAEDLLKNDPPIHLAKVDCTEAGKDTCNKYGVSGYPTLKIFRGGEFSQEYNGPRDASGIVKFMKAQVGPSSKEVTTVEEFERFLNAENDASVVGFFEKESDLKVAFLKLADSLREKVRFAHTSHRDVLDKYGVSNAVILFRAPNLQNKFEDASVQYTGSPNAQELKDFINLNYHGLAGHRTTDNRKDFQNPLIVAYYSVDYVKNPKGTNYWRNRIIKVAKQFTDYNFAISSKDEFQHEINEFGVEFSKGDKPIILARNEANLKFVMKDDFSVEALETFVRELSEGLLEPYLKSEPIPESNDEPVKVAVAKNFDDVVVNNGKDTLIEFYAPWCGHCKKLAPAYEELAKTLADEDVAIVKVDATANDVPPPFEVRGFPTIYWASKDGKDNPEKYEGPREVEDFIKFIAKKATKELKGYDRKGNPKQKTEL